MGILVRWLIALMAGTFGQGKVLSNPGGGGCEAVGYRSNIGSFRRALLFTGGYADVGNRDE